MDTVIIVLIVAVCTMITPITVSYIINREHQKERAEDYVRQDAVADKLELANKRADEAAQSGLGKMDIIHTLVNSNLTRQMQAELDATVRELVALKEISRLHIASGQEPSAESLAIIKDTENKIAELRAVMLDRERQAKKVTEQEAEARRKGINV